MALLRLTVLPPLLPVDDLLQRLSDLEGRTRGAAPSRAVPAPPPARAETIPPAAASPPTAAAPRAAAPPAGERSWEAFVAFAQAERPTLAEHLAKCALSRLDNQQIATDAPRGFRADYLSRRDHVAQIEDLAARFFGRPMRVQVTAATPSSVAAAAAPRATAAELTSAAMQDPAVQTAVNILGGEIAEVRERRPRRREES
jgi:hypothetical protein